MKLKIYSRKTKKTLVLDFLRHPLLWILYITVIEHFLARSIPDEVFAIFPNLGYVIHHLESVLPVVKNIQPGHFANPDSAKCYVSITLCFLVVKTFLIFRYINSDKVTIYRHLVVSPLTNTKPAGTDKFIMEPLRVENDVIARNKPRSMFSRVFVSSLVLLLSLGFLIMTLNYFTEASMKNPKYSMFKTSLLWKEYTMEILAGTSMFCAVSACILRDTATYVGSKFRS